MHLIGSALSPYVARVTLQLALKGREIELLARPGEPGSDAMAELNPFGKIPVLVTESGKVIESIAIMEYLEDADPRGNGLRPTDPFRLAQMRGLIMSFDQYVLPHQMPLYFKAFGMPTSDEEFTNARNSMAASTAKLGLLLDRPGPYLCGDAVTLADCALAPFFPLMGRLCDRLGVSNPLVETPVLARWWDGFGQDEQVGRVSRQLVSAFDERLAG